MNRRTFAASLFASFAAVVLPWRAKRATERDRFLKMARERSYLGKASVLHPHENYGRGFCETNVGVLLDHTTILRDDQVEYLNRCIAQAGDRDLLDDLAIRSKLKGFL